MSTEREQFVAYGKTDDRRYSVRTAAGEAICTCAYNPGSYADKIAWAQRIADALNAQADRSQAPASKAPSSTQAEPAPIDMVLHCPACGMQHIDAPEWVDDPHDIEQGRIMSWKNEPHRSHLCHGCGHIWRPADVPTNGVAAVRTKGKADSHIATHAAAPAPEVPSCTYASTQATNCAGCGKRKHTPLRIDAMGGYVCLTCIDTKLGGLLGEFGVEDDELRIRIGQAISHTMGNPGEDGTVHIDPCDSDEIDPLVDAVLEALAAAPRQGPNGTGSGEEPK